MQASIRGIALEQLIGLNKEGREDGGVKASLYDNE